jgi:DNA-binding GntR family transcriptional regulator
MELDDLAEVRRAPPLAEQIYLRLRQQLRSGALAPAERLVDAALAQSLNVSRTPVREALSRLAADGLLETQGGGFQVVTPTGADMEEIFQMRRLLEPPAASQAARVATSDAQDQLHAAFEQARIAEKAADFAAFAAANYAYRAVWVSRVPNRRLRETILRFDDQAGLVRSRTLVLPEARAEALALLKSLTAAFRQRDEAQTASLTLRFIDTAARFFQRTASEDRAQPSDRRTGEARRAKPTARSRS